MPSVIQVENAVSDFGASGLSLSFGSAITSGSSVIVYMRDGYDPDSLSNFATVTDNQSNTYIMEWASTNYDGLPSAWFRCHGITNAPTSLTITWPGGGSRNVNCAYFEVSGLASSAVSDFGRSEQAFGTSITDSLTAVGASACGLAYIDPSRDITPQSGFTREPATGSGREIAMYDADMGAAGSKTFGATWTGDANVVMWSMIYESASSGPAAPVRSAVLRQMLNN